MLRSVVVGVQGHDDVGLVEAARAGDPVAFGRLFDRWFDRTYDVAWHIVRNPDTAAEIAQDSFLTAWQQLPTLRQPASFGGWVLRIARNRSLNRLERERRTVPSGDETVMAVLDGRADQGDIAADLADQERDQMIWAAAAALGERDASLLDLHLRHDLSAAAIAEELDTSPNNVHQLLHRLRGRLAGAIRSWVLWKDGRTRCDGLARALDAAAVTRFGPEAVRVISTHAADCDVCGEAQRAVLAPEALFAAVPVVAAPVALKAQAASALMSAGVPLGSAVSRMASEAAGSAGPPGGAGSGGAGSGGAAGGGGPSGTAGPAGSGTGAAHAGAVHSGETAAVGTSGGAPGAATAAASGRAPRALRALRPAASGRRLVVAGAAVVALVAAVVIGVVLSDPAERIDRQGAEESDIASGNGPGDDGTGTGTGTGPGTEGSDGVDPREISATTTPTTGPGGAPGDEVEPDGGAGLPGTPGAGGGSGGGSSGPGPGGSEGPGGGSDGPGTPPGGGSSTTLPGDPTDPPGTTTTSTPPDPGADPPQILAFEARVGAPCGQLPLLRSVVLVWASVDGESASLGLVGGLLGGSVPPSGSATKCVLLGDIYLLTVTGPGGRDRAQLEIAL